MILLIRHGQSLGNIGACTSCDCDLSEEGVEQARAAGAVLRSDYDLSNVHGITSPYLRARRTAMYLSEATGLGFEPHPGCREWGKTCQVIDEHYPEETLAEVITRLEGFLGSLKANQSYVIVSHATPIFVMKQLLGGATRDEALTQCVGEFWNSVPNCGIHCAGD